MDHQLAYRLRNRDLPAIEFSSVPAMKYARKIVNCENQLTVDAGVGVVASEEYCVFLVFQEVVEHHYSC